MNLPLNNSKNASLRRRGLVLKGFTLAVACFALSSTARALLPPPAPDGGYPNQNTAEGENALFNLTNGIANTAIGYKALFSNKGGVSNTATGYEALSSTTNGEANTATGYLALLSTTTSRGNTATGAAALLSNTIGSYNTASGSIALNSNDTGDNNTATGSGALYRNVDGHDNTATGVSALLGNTSGTYNTADGTQSLYRNTTGFFNTANGANALFSNTTGSYNTAEGLNALYGNTIGSNNIALGLSAGADRTVGSNNIDIGNRGLAGESSHIRIGTKGRQSHTFIAGISGASVPGGVGVIIDSNGHLGTVVSSERFKEEIKPMEQASDAILSLKPVTFRYKQQLDPEGIPQFGLVAEEVEKVNPALVARDEEGKPYTVRYEAINAMLLNEFLKEHGKVRQQQIEIAQQRKDFTSAFAWQEARAEQQEARATQQAKEINALTAALKQQATQVQILSAQLAITNSATRMAAQRP